MRLDLRKNLGGAADKNLEKLLESNYHIEAVKWTEEEDNVPRVAGIQSNKNFQLVNSIKDLERAFHTSQPNRQNGQ